MHPKTSALGAVLRDLDMLGSAVDSARRQADAGAGPGPQLAAALEAGERAQAGLIELLRDEARVPGRSSRVPGL